jgi:hypothetical protein
MVLSMWEKGEKENEQIFFLSFLGVLFGGLLVLVALHSYMMVLNVTTCKL